MKIKFFPVLLCFVNVSALAQSVSIEPGQSVFANSPFGTEIKAEHTRPLKLSAEGHLTPIDFYNYSQLNGQIRTSYSSMQIHGRNGVLLFPTIDSTLGPKLNLNASGKLVLADNAHIGLYRLNVLENDENVAFFGTSITGGSAVVNINNRARLRAGRIISDNNMEDFASLNSTGLLFVNSEKQQNYSANGNYAMRIDESGRVTVRPVYIGNNAFQEAKANLDVGGAIRSHNLDFAENTPTEKRPVFADKDGILSITSSSNQYASYNFSHVQAQNWIDELRRGSGFAWFNTTSTVGTMYLPLNLPDGVKITNVRMYLMDNSASDISFIFSRNSHTTNTFTTIASATSSGAYTSLRTINDEANEVISNLDNSYYINISSVGNWTGNTLQFHSLVITYQY